MATNDGYWIFPRYGTVCLLFSFYNFLMAFNGAVLCSWETRTVPKLKKIETFSEIVSLNCTLHDDLRFLSLFFLRQIWYRKIEPQESVPSFSLSEVSGVSLIFCEISLGESIIIILCSLARWLQTICRCNLRKEGSCRVQGGFKIPFWKLSTPGKGENC